MIIEKSKHASANVDVSPEFCRKKTKSNSDQGNIGQSWSFILNKADAIERRLIYRA